MQTPASGKQCTSVGWKLTGGSSAEYFGNLADGKLNISQQCTLVAKKANSIQQPGNQEGVLSSSQHSLGVI